MTGYLILAGLLALVGLWIAALIDCSRTDADRFERNHALSKDLTLLLVFLTGGFGALYWFLLLRRRVNR